MSLAADCYNPDGSNRNQDPDQSQGSQTYQPCNQYTKFSMCCRDPNNSGDVCRDNGLCEATGADGSKILWRESCTDPTWNSPYCLKGLCTEGTDELGEENAATDRMLTRCPDDSWCCGGDNGTCCIRGDGKWIDNGRVTDINPILAQNSSANSSTSSTGASSNQNISSTDQNTNSDSGPNAGAIAGGTVGAVVVVAVLIFTLWYLRRRTNKRRAEQNYSPPEMAAASVESPSPQGLVEAYAPLDRKEEVQLDGTERFEIGHQDTGKDGRQEMAA
ncbi:MAG: hypothetical protein Q9219_005624 [cf. Caloplaca sp. 3 TL-2023]